MLQSREVLNSEAEEGFADPVWRNNSFDHNYHSLKIPARLYKQNPSEIKINWKKGYLLFPEDPKDKFSSSHKPKINLIAKVCLVVS